MYWKLFTVIVLLITMFGCSTKSAEEQIHQQLTKAMELEEAFKQQQPKITKLETEEQEIYSQIIAHDMEDEEKLQELVEQAIASIDERAEEVEVEKESIEASKKEFSKIEDLLLQIEDKETRETAKEMYERMNDRYDAYDDLYTVCQKTLQLEKELYTMIVEKTPQQELTEHIQKINENYELVLDANEQFNTYTLEYNDLKDEFYDTANLEQSPINKEAQSLNEYVW